MSSENTKTTSGQRKKLVTEEISFCQKSLRQVSAVALFGSEGPFDFNNRENLEQFTSLCECISNMSEECVKRLNLLFRSLPTQNKT
jgi:hypothetical protein